MLPTGCNEVDCTRNKKVSEGSVLEQIKYVTLKQMNGEAVFHVQHA